MSNTYSLINDLYGVDSERRRPERQSNTGLVIVLALTGAFLYESVHPVMRLRSNPPADFVQVAANHKAPVRAQQESLARSYWTMAAQYVSEKYTYGEALPLNPPADFTLSSGQDYATRALYWQRLRALWSEQSVWDTSYQFDTDWVSGALESIRGFVKDYLSL
jgi:hypothetical protein